MLWWVYISIVVFASLVINFTIAFFVGMLGGATGVGGAGFQLYPDWLVELHIAYFWFALIAKWLLDVFCNPVRVLDRRKVNIEELRGMISYVMLAHMISTGALRLLGVHWMYAYPIPFAVTVIAPVMIARAALPLWNKRQEEERLSEDAIRAIAEGGNLARQFMRAFPQAQAVVYCNERKNATAFCVFWTRNERDDLPGLREDTVLEVPVDMRKREVAGDGVLSRYIFLSNDAGTAVQHLPPPHPENLDAPSAPLDAFTLDKMNSAMYRHPHLEEAPLPLVTRELTKAVPAQVGDK
jgi:hypothetical protein